MDRIVLKPSRRMKEMDSMKRPLQRLAACCQGDDLPYETILDALVD